MTSKFKSLFGIFILGLSISFGPSGLAAGLTYNAENMDGDLDSEIIQLSGSVQIVYNLQHIAADKATLYKKQKKLELSGNVSISSEKSSIQGDHIILDYEAGTGIIENGFVQTGTISFSGKLLEKLSDDEFFVKDALYTACTNCPASWSFSGTVIRAELGGYAFIKNSILRLSGLPILWLPYLVVPLKSDRQSGLLTPGFETSDQGGVAYSQPYFWAISQDKDATITLKNYELRGLKTLLEYRYAINATSGGTLDAAINNDKAFANQDRLNRYRDPSQQGNVVNRYFLKYDHHLDLPENFTHRLQLNMASDLQYPEDFPLETSNYGDAAMENRVSISQHNDDQLFTVDASYYTNMLHADPLSKNEDAVHRLPEVSFSQTPKSIGNSGFIYAFDLNFVSFVRDGLGYDDMDTFTNSDGTKVRYVKNNCNQPNWQNNKVCYAVHDGVYDPSVDLIRTGQRLDLQPTLSYPVKFFGDFFEVNPKLLYRETHYNFNVGDDRNYIRRFLRTEVSGRTTLYNIYGQNQKDNYSIYKHEIIPEITYTSIPWLDQKNHPFFGVGQANDAPYSTRDNISDIDLGSDFGLQFDYYDRIFDRKLMTFAVNNKIIEKSVKNGVAEYKQLVALRLAQSYDIAQAERSNDPNREPWSDISATLDVRLDHFQTYGSVNYFPYQGVANSSTRVRVLNDRGQFAQLQFNSQYKISPGQSVDVSTRIEDYTAAAGFISKYLNLMGRLVYDGNYKNSTTPRQVKSWAYIAQLKPPGDCWLITFIHDQTTSGNKNFRFNFEFNFDGVPKIPLPPEALDQFGF